MDDPFRTIDRKGVGTLMKIAVEGGRGVKDLELGICGEHGGILSIAFVTLGLDYVSCSSMRIPVRLSAAHASLGLLN